MTKEKALEILSHDRERLIDARGADYSGVEALDMAIRSLEAWNEVLYEIANKATLGNVGDLVLCMKIIDKHLQEVEE